MLSVHFIIFANLPLVLSLQQGLCAEAFVYSINPVSVEAEEDFTVGIEIDNCGEEIPNDITFEITKYDPEIYIKDPLKINVGELGFSNSKRFIVYHLRTSENIKSGEHVFDARLSYGKNLSVIKDYNFSITVIAKEPQIALSGIKTIPETLKTNEEFVLVVKVQNSGKGKSKFTRVELEGLNLEGIKEAYLGEIKSGEELPARFVLRSKKAGSYDFNVKIFYNSLGDINFVQFPYKIYVFSNYNYYYYLLAFIVLLLLIIAIYFYKRNSNLEEE
jgi:hypothetical protein